MNNPKSSQRSCIIAIRAVLYYDQGQFGHPSAALNSHTNDRYLALQALANVILVKYLISLRCGSRETEKGDRADYMQALINVSRQLYNDFEEPSAIRGIILRSGCCSKKY